MKMNFMMQQGRLFVQKTICKRCVMEMTRKCLVVPCTTQISPWSQHDNWRGYHNVRLETVSEVWQQLKKEFRQLKKASVNRPPDPKDFELGLEIGTGIYLIKANATVHFTNGRWYGKHKEGGKKVVFPAEDAVGYAINAIDARATLLDQNGFRDIVKLNRLKFLNIEGCQYVDDACLAHLVHVRESLTHLNINKCSNVTANGLATLHKLRKLEHLNMSDLPNVRYPKLIATMLEEVLPKLRINIISNLLEKEEERAIETVVEENHHPLTESVLRKR